MLLRFWKDTQVVLHANLVVYVPVILQVSCVLVELLPVYAAYGIYDQVVMQVARVHMGGDQNFIIRELFFCQLHAYGVC